MLDDDGYLLTDVIRMESHPPGKLLQTFSFINLLVVIFLAAVREFEGESVWRVVLQYVEDELLLDGLLHTVNMEGFGQPGLTFPPEHLDRLGFGRRGEGEEADVFRLGAGPRIKPVRVDLKVKKRLDEAAKRLEASRKDWLNLIKTNPEASLTTLQSVFPFRRLYRRLKRNDPEWLRNHLPKARSKRGSFKNIEWGKVDSLLSKRVLLSAIKLKAVSGRPTRISIAAIGRATGQFGLLTHRNSYLSKLSLTFNVLDEVVESHVDYCVRRVQWATNCFREEGRFPTKTMIGRRTLLQWKSLCILEVRSAVDSAWQSLRKINMNEGLVAA